jgi:site-specific DNA-methyltransferase (adenine-specific)
MKLELVLIDDLDLDPRNARKHDAKNLKAIADSLEQFGQRKPIVVWGRTVVAGNGTMAAARTLGWTEITIARVPDDWSADQVKAYALADNRSAELAVWDEQVLAAQLLELTEAEFDVELLGFEIPAEPLADVVEDEIPNQVEPKAKLGDVWQLGKHRVMCGSSTSVDDVEKLTQSQQPDLVFTDPPYGIDVVSSSKGSGSNGGNKSFGSVVGSNIVKANNYSPIIGDSTTDTASDFYLTCKSLGFSNYVIWGGNYFTEFLPAKKCWFVWDKKGRKWDDNFSDFEMAWTSFDKPAKIFTYVWMGIVQSGQREKRVHPTQKPAGLVVDCLNYLDSNFKTIYDGFGGSGSTLIACEQTDRTCLMMELDPKYVDVIIARWEKLTGEQAQLIEG